MTDALTRELRARIVFCRSTIMTYDGICGVRRKIKLYPDDDNAVPQAGGILGGFDPARGYAEPGILAQVRARATAPKVQMSVNDIWRARAALAHHAAKMKARASETRMARDLARQGRGGDTEIAHVTRGEIVVPRALQNPQVIAVLRRAAAEANIPFAALSVGNRRNSINPKTGAPEFSLNDIGGDNVDHVPVYAEDTAPGDVPDYNFDLPDDFVQQQVDQNNILPDLKFVNPDGTDYNPSDTQSVQQPIDEVVVTGTAQKSGGPTQDAFGNSPNESGGAAPIPEIVVTGKRPTEKQNRLRENASNQLQIHNVKAGLALLSHAEGGAMGKWTGGQSYPPSNAHPGFNPVNKQSAAGPYQQQIGAWNDSQKVYGPLNFSDPNDAALSALRQLHGLNAVDHLINGDFDGFLSAASQKGGWDSLPPYGGHQTMTVDQAKQFINNYK